MALLLGTSLLWSTANFDCNKWLTSLPASSQTPAEILVEAESKYSGRHISFDEALTLTAELLGQDKDGFVTDVKAQNLQTTSFQKTSFPKDPAGQLEVLFEAIRTAFSKNTVDRQAWEKATPQERLRAIMHFKVQAIRTLFHRQKLFLRFRDAVPGAAAIDLAAMAPRRNGDQLFAEVHLNQDLVSQLPSTTSDVRLVMILGDYVDRTFIANIDSVFNIKAKPVNLQPITIASLAVAGGLAFYVILPMTHPPIQPPPQAAIEAPRPAAASPPPVSTPPPTTAEPQTPPPQAATQAPPKIDTSTNPIQKALDDYEKLSKVRPLTKYEETIRNQFREIKRRARSELDR